MGRHQGRLFRYLRRLLGDETMAEDLFQQTWLRAAEKIRRYDRRRPFGPWLLRVGRNLALDQVRRVRPESLSDDAEVADPAGGPGAKADAHETLATRERGERLGQALGRLSSRDREILSLRFEDDLSLNEISDLVEAPLPTVKARLYRALHRLRARLLEMGPRGEWTS